VLWQGKFSTKSDVWSFGVTLWELVTFAREQPYQHLSDAAVIDNCNHFYRGDGQQQYLQRPDGCPREIFDLVHECWNKEETCRPTFREIHMFMQRKNMGYNPRDDAGNSHVAMV
jgi:discoidin domain receptor family protein 2